MVRHPPPGLRKAAESKGFTAVLVSLALAAVIIMLGMIVFPDGGGQRMDNAANLQQVHLADTVPARFD